MGSLNILKETEIAYGLWLQEDEVTSSISSLPPLRDLTLSWLRFGYQGKVIESTSINTILDQAMEQGQRACFIQAPGNIISEDWMLPHWQQADFHESVQQHLRRDDFLICADFTEKEGYFSLDTNCFLVNLLHYRALGCPSFGFSHGLSTSEKHPLKLIKPQVMLVGNGGKSLKQLTASNNTVSIVPSGAGWGFIDASLRQGLTISQLPHNIANKRLLLQKNPQKISEEESISSQVVKNPKSTHKRFLNGIDTQINCGRKGVFLWNIESYDDLPEHNPNSIEKISNLYCVAAGFKPCMLLIRHGFNSDTCVTFFDYSQQALNIRKTLLEEWDGTNYPDFCQSLMERYPEPETLYQLWNGIQTSEINWGDVDILWENELEKWGGKEKFQQIWLAQRALKFQFVHCDVVNKPNALLDKISNLEGSVIWWSNAFFTISSNWLMTIEQRRKCFFNWVNHLADRAPECRIYGADYNNTPINDISAIEYYNILKTRFMSNNKHELTPVQSARPLRF